jgi:GNAT superfamily N-acetyltransferase
MTRVLRDVARTPPLLLAQKLLRRVPLRPIDVGKLCFLQLNRLPAVPTSLLRGPVEVRLATIDDIDALSKLQDKPLLFRQRFDESDQCVIAIAQGHIVGYEWFSDQAVHHESGWGYPVAIPAGYVYAYDAFIDPAYRNTGVWLRFKQFLAGWMATHGKRGVLTFVDYGNWPSLRTHLRFGFQPTESVLALRIIGLKLFRKVRGVSAAAWSYLVWCAMHSPAHLHQAARVLNAAATLGRR